MSKSRDLSAKDSKYFIDDRTYNCPFCNRRNVVYKVISASSFDLDAVRTVYLYRVQCSEAECGKVSLHLSNYKLHMTHRDGFACPPRVLSYKQRPEPQGGQYEEITPLLDDEKKPKELDGCFFYHQPSSFFTVDDRLPVVVRELLSEAENCRKNNFLTGASACLRKAIYKLLQQQEIPEQDKDGKFFRYDDRIDLLKDKFKGINPAYFGNLKIIQGLTSQELHENDWEDLDSPTLRFLLETTKVILYQIFVLPDEFQQQRDKILEFGKAAAKKNPLVKVET